MAQNQINTVIVLRNDQTTAWENSSHVLLKGEVGIGYFDNGNVIAKLGDGEHTWNDLKQLEGVFEDDVTLTYNFGKHVIGESGSLKVDAKGMTTSEWLIAQLADEKQPEITEATSMTISASCTGSGKEVGEYITAINWNGTTKYGSYTYNGTGLGEANRTWAISNDQTEDTSTSEDGSFAVSIQLSQEASKVYATITAEAKLDASGANVAKTNIGNDTDIKVSSIDKTLTASASATAYRKPFWGLKAAGAALDVENLTSAQIRDLGKSGTSTAGLPSTLEVPAGTQMVIFAARAGAKSSLTAKDANAMNAPVAFTKVEKAVDVEGANGFDATEYDIWYVDWKAGIDSAKSLTLTWA